MKTYKKAKVVAKNNPQGSYAAGCPTHASGGCGPSAGHCKSCETAR
ncbi:MAG: hypothetical protein WCK02_00220 [Bacteroidota bacterium]